MTCELDFMASPEVSERNSPWSETAPHGAAQFPAQHQKASTQPILPVELIEPGHPIRQVALSIVFCQTELQSVYSRLLTLGVVLNRLNSKVNEC
jgi:hypothetical protein